MGVLEMRIDDMSTGGTADGRVFITQLPEVKIGSGYDEPAPDGASEFTDTVDTGIIGAETVVEEHPDVDLYPAATEVAGGVGQLAVPAATEVFDDTHSSDGEADAGVPLSRHVAAAEAEPTPPAPDDGGDVPPPFEPPGTTEMPEPEPELPHGVQDLIDKTDQLLAEGNIGTPEQNLAYLRSLSSDDFEDLITHTAARSTGETTVVARTGERGIIVGDDSTTGREGVMYLAPRPEDRKPLLDETLAVAKAQPTAGRAFGLVSLQMGTIHPVHEGNGRTGRRLFALRNEYTGSAQDHEALATALTPTVETPEELRPNLNSRRLGLDEAFVEPIVCSQQERMGIGGPPINTVRFEGEGDLVMRSSIAPDEQYLAILAVQELNFNIPTMLSVIEQSGRPVERYLMRGIDGAVEALDGIRFLEDMTPRDFEHLERTIDQTKREFVHSINAWFMGDPAMEALYGSVDDLLQRMKARLP